MESELTKKEGHTMSQTQTISRNNTTVSTHGGKTEVTLHSTVIVSYDDVSITLNNGGWNTATTVTRMNQVSNEKGLCFWVSRRGGVMVAEYKGQRFEVSPSVTIQR